MNKIVENKMIKNKLLSPKIILTFKEELFLKVIAKEIAQIGLGFLVIETAQNVKDTLEKIKKCSPDLLITDFFLPMTDGLELIKNVSKTFRYMKIIIISEYNKFEYVQQAIKYGVSNYLFKPTKIEDLSEALLKVKLLIEAQNESHKAKTFKDISNNNSSQEVVDMVTEFIKENFRNEINLDTLAKKFNINASYLCKLFKRYHDETLFQHLMNLRINEAQHLLRLQPEMDIKSIGELVGYPDQFYFSRIFKQVIGMSPSKFRKQ